MDEEIAFAQLRHRMVDEQLCARGINDSRVLDTLDSLPRHRFVPLEERFWAYEDRPLPIGQGQTISQPYIVALMTQLLRLSGPEKVLEIGTGSGYQSALLASLAQEVHSVERVQVLAEQAQALMQELGFANVHIHVGDGTLGWPPEAPYDAIIVTAASPRVPQPLQDQLSPGGRLVLPVGSMGRQILQFWWREGERLLHDDLSPVAFVPLIGEHGWGL